MQGKQKKIGNPLSRQRRRRNQRRSLSKTGMMAVASLLGIFALAGIYVFVLPFLLFRQSTMNDTSSLLKGGNHPVMDEEENEHSNNLARSAAAIRRIRGQLLHDEEEEEEVLGGEGDAAAAAAAAAAVAGDWMEQQAKAQVEELAVAQMQNPQLLQAKVASKEYLVLELHQKQTKQSVDGKSINEALMSASSLLGTLRIRLRPDLSPESVAYIKDLVYAVNENQAQHMTQFYRSEKPGILQGILRSAAVPALDENKARGACPPGFENVHNDCPAWDTNCGCHGPIMTRGMVAWAGGKTGPDFFINDYKQPAKFWGTQHTVFGEIEMLGVDETSSTGEKNSDFELLDQIWTFPTTVRNGMTFLDQPISFTMALEYKN